MLISYSTADYEKAVALNELTRTDNELLQTRIEALHKELNYVRTQISTHRGQAHVWEVRWAEEARQCDLMRHYISEEDLNKCLPSSQVDLTRYKPAKLRHRDHWSTSSCDS